MNRNDFWAQAFISVLPTVLGEVKNDMSVDSLIKAAELLADKATEVFDRKSKEINYR